MCQVDFTTIVATTLVWAYISTLMAQKSPPDIFNLLKERTLKQHHHLPTKDDEKGQFAKEEVARADLARAFDAQRIPFTLKPGIGGSRRSQFANGTLRPEALGCDDELGKETCEAIFSSISRNEFPSRSRKITRPAKCVNPALARLARRCARTCAFCCQDGRIRKGRTEELEEEEDDDEEEESGKKRREERRPRRREEEEEDDEEGEGRRRMRKKNRGRGGTQLVVILGGGRGGRGEEERREEDEQFPEESQGIGFRRILTFPEERNRNRIDEKEIERRMMMSREGSEGEKEEDEEKSDEGKTGEENDAEEEEDDGEEEEGRREDRGRMELLNRRGRNRTNRKSEEEDEGGEAVERRDEKEGAILGRLTKRIIELVKRLREQRRGKKMEDDGGGRRRRKRRRRMKRSGGWMMKSGEEAKDEEENGGGRGNEKENEGRMMIEEVVMEKEEEDEEEGKDEAGRDGMEEVVELLLSKEVAEIKEEPSELERMIEEMEIQEDGGEGAGTDGDSMTRNIQKEQPIPQLILQASEEEEGDDEVEEEEDEEGEGEGEEEPGIGTEASSEQQDGNSGQLQKLLEKIVEEDDEEEEEEEEEEDAEGEGEAFDILGSRQEGEEADQGDEDEADSEEGDDEEDPEDDTDEEEDEEGDDEGNKEDAVEIFGAAKAPKLKLRRSNKNEIDGGEEETQRNSDRKKVIKVRIKPEGRDQRWGIKWDEPVVEGRRRRRKERKRRKMGRGRKPEEFDGLLRDGDGKPIRIEQLTGGIRGALEKIRKRYGLTSNDTVEEMAGRVLGNTDERDIARGLKTILGELKALKRGKTGGGRRGGGRDQRKKMEGRSEEDEEEEEQRKGARRTAGRKKPGRDERDPQQIAAGDRTLRMLAQLLEDKRREEARKMAEMDRMLRNREGSNTGRGLPSREELEIISKKRTRPNGREGARSGGEEDRRSRENNSDEGEPRNAGRASVRQRRRQQQPTARGRRRPVPATTVVLPRRVVLSTGGPVPSGYRLVPLIGATDNTQQPVAVPAQVYVTGQGRFLPPVNAGQQPATILLVNRPQDGSGQQQQQQTAPTVPSQLTAPQARNQDVAQHPQTFIQFPERQQQQLAPSAVPQQFMGPTQQTGSLAAIPQQSRLSQPVAFPFATSQQQQIVADQHIQPVQQQSAASESPTSHLVVVRQQPPQFRPAQQQFVVQHPQSPGRAPLLQPRVSRGTFTVLRNAPQPPAISTSSALCRDYHPYCELIVPRGFCISDVYPLRMKREFCPQSCGLC